MPWRISASIATRSGGVSAGTNQCSACVITTGGIDATIACSIAVSSASS